MQSSESQSAQRGGANASAGAGIGTGLQLPRPVPLGSRILERQLAISSWVLYRDNQVGCLRLAPIDRIERRAGR
jgi:hypothetical protein